MRVLIVVARRFNGHELGNAMKVLTARGHKFSIVSTDYNIEDEVTGHPLKIRRVIGEIKPDHDALSIISGNMADTEAYWHDKTVLGYVEQFNNREAPISAICCSVPTVRYAAKGKEVSFFPLIRSRKLLESAGAICTPVTLSVDQNLVTAEHQMASEIWADEFCNLMEGQPQTHFFKASGFTPRGLRPRREPPALTAYKEKMANRAVADVTNGDLEGGASA